MDQNPSIVVIEDSQVQALKLKHLLEEQGSRVECVGTAEAAFDLLNGRRADLVLVDYHLPGMKGDEFCRQIRLNVATRDIPVLMLTDDTGDGVEEMGLESGADAYISKAAETEVLLLRINTLLKKSSGAAPLFADGARHFRTARLLVVDDSATFRQYLNLQLSEEGYGIETATNGHDVLKMVQKDRFDCVVVDLIMPGMDGIELCRRLQNIRKTVDSPITVLMLTSSESKDDMMRGLEAGADDFVVKSADIAVLKARIRALLRRKFLLEENQRIIGEFRAKELELAHAEAERRSAEERARLTDRLEQVNKELEAFCYSVSHDLRAPLRGMDGFSQALLEDYGHKLDDTGKDYLMRVRRASQTMAMLIDDLLALSRVNRGEIEKRRVNLSQIASLVADGLKQTAPDRAVEFKIAPKLFAECDERLMHAAFENLLGNAWKYTSKKKRATIEVGAAEHNGAEAFFVRDNGAGFDMAYADKLFEPFTRLHSKNEFEGTGVGLATVQRIIHRHGGKIWAEAAVGKGTTLYFTL